MHYMKHFGRIIGLIATVILILVCSAAVFLYAQGYRINLETQSLHTTNILVANSFPNEADIYLNGKRQGVTQKTLYLLSKPYDVTVQKEGYTKWQKRYQMQPETVYRTDALMFSLNPSLSPITNRGIIAPAISPERSFIMYIKEPDDTTAFTVPGEPEKSGIFRAPLTNTAFSLFQNINLLVPYSQLPQGANLEKTSYIFSPDEKQVLALFKNSDDELISVLLIPLTNPNALIDVTQSYQTIVERWNNLQDTLQSALIDTQKKPVREIFRNSTHIIDVSPDKERILYFATAPASLPLVVKPALNGQSPIPETRTLNAGNYYVYDTKNDKNYLLDVFSKEERAKTLKSLKAAADWQEENALFKNIFWYGDSKHVVTVLDDIFNVIDYDGTNNVLVYSGPFDKTVYGGTSDGKIVIVTNLNPKRNKNPDLYAISIR